MSLFESVRGPDCFIVRLIYAPVDNDIMELLTVINAMKRASAARITTVIPYFGYARQDHKAKVRDPTSTELVVDLITTTGADRISTMGLYAPQIQSFFNAPVDRLLGAPILSSFLKDRVGNNSSDHVAVSPNLSSVARTRNFAARIGSPLATINKHRQKANVSEVMNIIGDARDKKVILVDDMTNTAGALCNATTALAEVGGAIEVTACATRGVLSGPAMERIENDCISELVLLDTIPVPEGERLPNFVILPVTPLFAEAIERTYEDEPVSPMFV